MDKHSGLEIAVGAFVALGFAVLAYLSVSLGEAPWAGPSRYPVQARFATVGGLKAGAAVKIAGVAVGRVERIELVDYAADTTLAIEDGVRLPADTFASIRTEGLLGESYVDLTPGGAEGDVPPGGRLPRTEPPVDLIDLVSRYAFGNAAEGSPEGAEPAPPGGDPFE